MFSFSACTHSAAARHGLPNAIAENEAHDHAYQKLHFYYPWAAKRKGQPFAFRSPHNLRKHAGALSKDIGPRILRPISSFGFRPYIHRMLWRLRNSRGRPMNAPAAFIHPCQPIVAKQPPWALRHDTRLRSKRDSHGSLGKKSDYRIRGIVLRSSARESQRLRD